MHWLKAFDYSMYWTLESVQKHKQILFKKHSFCYRVFAYLKAASLSKRQLWSEANLKMPKALDGSSWRTKWSVQISTTSRSSIMSPAISNSWTFSLVTLIWPVYINSSRLANVIPSKLWITAKKIRQIIKHRDISKIKSKFSVNFTGWFFFSKWDSSTLSTVLKKAIFNLKIKLTIILHSKHGQQSRKRMLHGITLKKLNWRACYWCYTRIFRKYAGVKEQRILLKISALCLLFTLLQDKRAEISINMSVILYLTFIHTSTYIHSLSLQDKIK